MAGLSPMARPAEWSGVAGAVALLLARAFGVSDAGTITDIAIVIGFLPTAATTLVTYIRSFKKKNGGSA